MFEPDVAAIRAAAGLPANEGPDDHAIASAAKEFLGQFEYWYTRVIADAVSRYRALIVRRINPLVRPIEFEGLSCADVASRLVGDYVNRNFVTAGGWAIERMAIALAAAIGGVKASSRGIDLERTDDAGNRHLYVIKSGTVTRNSDILSKLKQHARDAERLIKQGGSKVGVFASYVVAAGATSSTFEDGIYRPSSGEFWAEITGVSEQKALALVRAIAESAGRQVTRETDVHIGALRTLVESYISADDDRTKVDWPFIFELTMSKREKWAKEDEFRNSRAVDVLTATGYEIAKARTGARTAESLESAGKVARGKTAAS